MTVFQYVGLVAALIAIIAFFIQTGRWIAKMDANTSATEKLSSAFETFSGTVRDRLFNHEQRITTLEAVRTSRDQESSR